MDTSNQTAQAQLSSAISEINQQDVPPEEPLSLSRRAEIWSGRFAMLGFTTTVMAIALKSSF